MRNKIAISFAGLAILLATIIILSLYAFSRIQARENTRQRLMDIAQTASLLINADLHALLNDPAQQDSENYLTIRYELDRILRSNPNIEYAYTMRLIDGQVVFVVDSIEGEGEPADLLEVYDEAEDVLLNYLATADRPWAEEEFTTDEWGTVLSGYAPLVTSDGKVDGVIGIDMRADDVKAYESQFFRIALLALLISVPLATVMGWFIGNQLAAPIISLTGDVSTIASGNLQHRAEITSRDEVARLATAFNNLTEQIQFLIRELEVRVTERTSELEKRSRYLQATNNVSQSIATILDPNELSYRIVDEMRDQFALYYVGLFLVDEPGEWAVLKAGTGQAGQTMVARGHRIRIGQGMIGWSIANARSRIAQQAEDDVVRLATAELPRTQSELALPLRSRGQVLGALTVQSEAPKAFDKQFVSVLQSIADQVAVALENSLLYAQSQEALEAERRAYGRVSELEWQKLFRSREILGYRYKNSQITPSRGNWYPEMVAAAKTGVPIQDSDGNLAMPIKIRDQIIGVLRFHKDVGNHSSNGEETEDTRKMVWSNEEIYTLENILIQVSQAVENARLYQETQRRAAQELMSGEITARMRTSLDLDAVIRTAVREFGDRLGATKVEVILGETPVDETPDSES